MSGPFSVAADLLNHLYLRYPRRITVQMGDIDLMFAAVGTVHGKKQRLQALGHYYEPFTAATGNDVTEAYTNCLAYWRAKRETALAKPFPGDADVETDMQAQIRSFIVEGGVLPPKGSAVKLRVPGALTFSVSNDLGDGGVADGGKLTSVRFNDEAALWSGNTALGQVPITFKVEKLVNKVWVPSPDDFVHVQLVPPFYDEPPANELADVNAQRSTGQRPALAGIAGGATENHGIQQFLTAAMNDSFDAGDPQRYNAHQNRGGKRGLAVLGNVFGPLPAAFPGLNAPDASPAPRTNSVRVKTNATGDGGVTFMPSRMGGDRYRMRIFLDPISGDPSDGTGAAAVAFETGRFTVTKHVLWSRYLPKPAPNFPALNSVDGMQARLTLLGYDAGPIDGKDGPLTRKGVTAFQVNHPPLPHNGQWSDAGTQTALDATVTQFIGGGGPVYTNGFGPAVGPFVFATATAQFQVMYCELEIEPAITGGSQLTSAQYRDAIHWAIAQCHATRGGLGAATRNVLQMFTEEFETPFLFQIVHPRQYNRARGAGFPAAVAGGAGDFAGYWNDAASVIYNDNGLLQLFLRYLTGGASAANPPTANLTRYSTPGLTVVSAMSASWLFWSAQEAGLVAPPAINVAQASGIATKERAASVYGGVGVYASWIYLGDGYTKNALHEIGHTLYLRHQFTGSQLGTWLHAEGNFREDHDSLTTVPNPQNLPDTVPYDRCLMGYQPSDGDFCGKCHLKIRGWDISQMPV
jgi:hypothetical protein